MKYQQENKVNYRRISKYTRISKAYQKRAFVYGKQAEIIEYNDLKITFLGGRTNYEKKKKGKRRNDSIVRSRANVYRITACNIGKHGDYPPIFLTLTFKENVKDLKKANEIFKKFIMRLNYRIGFKLKYLFIPEFQKRGSVHYHGILFNMPYIDKTEIQEIWGQGFSRIETLKKVRDMSAYISKYLSKETFDNRLFGQRILMTSRGLFRPQDIFGSHEVDDFYQSVRIIDEVVISQNKKATLKKIKFINS